MASLYSKHFGNKVFLHDLDEKVVKKMLAIPCKDKRNKVPNFGTLIRFEDDTVGLCVQWLDRNGHPNYSREITQHRTIFSWARFHTFDCTCVQD